MIDKSTLPLVFAVCAAVTSAGADVSGPPSCDIPMVRAAWEKHNPLGGEFENGRYVVLHEQAPAFEVARDFPASSNLVVEALFTPERDIPGEGNSAIAILESPGRYWHLFLAKNGRGVRHFGLNELGGYTQLQASLDRNSDVLERALTDGIRGVFNVYGKGGLVDSYDTGKKNASRHGERY